ncbi:MAG: hypothetical protein ACYDC2_07895 [Solirubrobacteraceae bacterium]
MNPRRLRTLLSIALCAALLAGCGSSSKSASSSSSSAAGAPASSPSTSTAGKAPASSTEVKAATEECKHIIAGASKLTSGAKQKLEGACSAAAHGELGKVKTVAKEVCEEAINSSKALPASLKEKALAACNKT